jgi:hypothetical protein
MTPDLCEHIIADGHVNQPIALLTSDDGAAYVCPACLADEVQRRIETESPAELGAAISFAHCDHQHARGSEVAHCLWCQVGSTASLSLLWSRLKFTDPSTATNRLGKLIRILGKYNINRSAVRAIDPVQEAGPKPVHSKRLLRSESLNGDRARASRKWYEGREQRLRTHKVPAQTISVIPPSQAVA